jgi:hypothetical protein
VNFFHERALRAGSHLYFERGYDLLKIALAMHEPKIVKGRTRVGWDGHAFRFRRCFIKDGVVRQHDPALFPADCPGPQVKAFRLRKPAVEALSVPGTETEVTWAVLVSLLTSILRPPEGHAGPRTIVNVPDGRPVIESILARCSVSKHSVYRETNANHEPKTIRWLHRWPLHLVVNDRVLNPAKLRKWVVSAKQPGLLYYAASTSSYLALLHAGAQLVHCHHVLRGATASRIPVEHALLSYLRYASAQMPRCATAAHPWWDTVQQHVAGWLESEGGDAGPLRASRRWVDLAEDADVLPKVIRQLYADGYLSLTPSSNHGRQSAPVDFDERGLIVPLESLEKALTFLGGGFDLREYPDPIIVGHKWFTYPR